MSEIFREAINYIKSHAKTVDDFLANIGLGRPLERIINFFEVTAPSRIAKKLELPPAPGEVVDMIVESAERGIEEMKLPPVGEEVKKRIREVMS